ncbi:DUF6503 family protein [Seonamhaeicola maritimus]|uniref:DUF6503 family protein n=1 Tax=Seonamhaeicola maritimus TaxID=2591822 RepID=UPI001478813D|nr:DUF6503 family protein [Seonamhaeicola maritimus]
MLKRTVLLILVAFYFFGCNNKPIDANVTIDKSIRVSGGDLIKTSTIEFDFRDIHYIAIRNNGSFELGRSFSKDSLIFTDKLSNSGFKRTINDVLVKVSDSMIPRYSASVNSVHYFSVLPYGLNDAAVNKSYLNDVNIKGNTYHKIKVIFNEECGGEDYEDIFFYFVNKDTFKVDYLSYSYAENHGIGLRFREAYNERFVNGIRFVDYNNYKPKEKSESLENLEILFENNGLELLSKIQLKNVKVN